MTQPDDFDEGIERLLRESRPVPDAAWRGSLRREVTSPRAGWHRVPRIRVASLAVVAVAVAFIVAGLLGGGPLSGLTDQPVTAKDDCHYIVQTVERRVPRVVEGPSGTRVEYERRLVQERVKRCD